MDIFWLVVVVAGLVMWQKQRSQIRHLAARVAALESLTRPSAAATVDFPDQVSAAATWPTDDAAASALSAPPTVETAPEHVGAMPARPERDLERRFGQRWLVWIGAMALALGGVFIVQYSIEQDLIGPIPRLLLGLLVGLLLILGAEFVRKRPDRLRLTSAQTAHAASALAAGGIAALFGVGWASFELYALVPSGVALLAMALSAGVALLLAWHHGPLLAVIALLFGYLAPVLVTAEAPDAPAFAAWLIAVQLVLALTLRFRPWMWLLALDLLGLVPLGVILMAGSNAGLAAAPFVTLAATTLPVWLCRPPSRDGGRIRRLLLAILGLEGRVWIGAALMAATCLVAIDAGEGATWPIVLFAILLVGASLLGRTPVQVAFAAAACVVVVAAVQSIPWLFTPMAEMLGDTTVGTSGWRWLAPEHVPFARFCAGMAIGFFLAGWLGAIRLRHAGAFAALAVTVPLALLVVAYGRIAGFTAAPRWTVVALVLAGLFLLGAERTVRHRPDHDAPLAAFTLGIVGSLALGLTMALDLAWLTLALAVELLAIVLIQPRFPIATLGRLAACLASIVAGRLLWQAADLGPRDLVETSLWAAIWSYGAPTLLILSSYVLGGRLVPPWTRDALAAAGAAAWIIALMRIIAVGVGSDHKDDLLEPSLQVAALTLTTVTLALRPPSRLISAAIVLSALMTFACLVQPLVRILDGQALRIIDLSILNPFLLLLPLPALGLAFVLWQRRSALKPAAIRIGASLVLLLLLLWPILEIRRSFTNSVIWGYQPIQVAENWLYSAWLVVAAVGLLALGLLKGVRDLRLASLGLLILAILKVFLLDLGDLEGLWRAAAFLGLGMALVGVGLAYQRLFADDRTAPASGQ